MKAVKNAQALNATMARPAGIQPISAEVRRTSRRGRAAFAEQVAGKGEQRDGQQNGHFRDAEELDGHHLQVDIGLLEIPHGAGGDYREQGRAQQRQQQQ